MVEAGQAFWGHYFPCYVPPVAFLHGMPQPFLPCLTLPHTFLLPLAYVLLPSLSFPTNKPVGLGKGGLQASDYWKRVGTRRVRA